MQEHPIGNGVLTARIPREFAAAIEALQLAGSNTDALLELNDAEWHRLLDVCDLAHLTLALAQLPTAGFPAWVVERLERNVSDNTLRSRHVQSLYIEAAEALTREGVPHVVIKGFTLAPGYVADPRYRLQSDLDFYVPKHHMDAAVSALTAIGYTKSPENHSRFADHTPSLVRPGGAWKGNMYDPDLALGIELHFSLWNSPVTRVTLPEIDLFWRRRVLRRSGSFAFWSLSETDQLGYFALHVLRDVFSGEWVVHHVFDLATFLHRRAGDAPFWAQWQTLHSARLRQIQAVAFLISHTWFSAQLAPAVQQEIAALPADLVRWVAILGAHPLESTYRNAREGRLLQYLLADSWQAKLHALRRALIPVALAVPSGPYLRSRNHRVKKGGADRYYLDRIAYLGYAIGTRLVANAEFLANALRFFVFAAIPDEPLLRPRSSTQAQYAVDGSGR